MLKIDDFCKMIIELYQFGSTVKDFGGKYSIREIMNYYT